MLPARSQYLIGHLSWHPDLAMAALAVGISPCSPALLSPCRRDGPGRAGFGFADRRAMRLQPGWAPFDDGVGRTKAAGSTSSQAIDMHTLLAVVCDPVFDPAQGLRRCQARFDCRNLHRAAVPLRARMLRGIANSSRAVYRSCGLHGRQSPGMHAKSLARQMSGDA